MKYAELAEDLSEIADHYTAESKNCDGAVKSMYRGNAQMFLLASTAIRELLDRLVKQACHYEQIEARDDK